MEKFCFNWLDVIALFGGFLAFLLGCIFIFNEKFKTKSNIVSAISLFSLFILTIQNIIEIQLYQPQLPINLEHIIYYLPIFYAIFIPVGFYYNIIYLLNPAYQLQQKDYWFMFPIGIVVIIDLIRLYQYLFRFDSILANSQRVLWYGNFINLIIIVYFLITLVLCWNKINIYQKNLLNNFSFIEGKNLQWLRNAIVCIWVMLGVFIALRISVFFLPSHSESIFYLLWFFVTGFICLCAFQVIINQNYYLIPQFKTTADPVVAKGLSEKTGEHYQHLLTLMQKEKLFQNPELNMDMLSQKMELSKGYLSKIINQKENKNFYDFINHYRVEEVKRNLHNPDFAHYSILGIGMAAGFKSKSTFNTVFKKMTGMTPSAYKKKIVV